MTIVTTYTQQDFDLLVALGMPDTQEPTNFHYFGDEETQAVIEFTVSDIISKAYTEIKDITRNSYLSWNIGGH